MTNTPQLADLSHRLASESFVRNLRDRCESPHRYRMTEHRIPVRVDRRVDDAGPTLGMERRQP